MKDMSSPPPPPADNNNGKNGSSRKKRQRVDVFNFKELEDPTKKQTIISFTAKLRSRRRWSYWVMQNSGDPDKALEELMDFRGIPKDVQLRV